MKERTRGSAFIRELSAPCGHGKEASKMKRLVVFMAVVGVILFASLVKVELLVIDDFAFKKIDQKSAEYFYGVVDERYRQKSIILTSTRAMNDWASIFPNPVMDNAIMDRLAHNAHQIIIKGESYRKKYRPKFAYGE